MAEASPCCSAVGRDQKGQDCECELHISEKGKSRVRIRMEEALRDEMEHKMKGKALFIRRNRAE